MLDPFSLVPMAAAAHGGRVDDFDTRQLAAAGVTLLQRSAPLVRALSGKRSAILLPASPQSLVALAASDGRAAVLIDPRVERAEIARRLRDANVGAVFTNVALAEGLPHELPRVLLDDAPRTAKVIAAGASRDVDLGSHHGLSVEGESDAPGSDEDVALVYSPVAPSFTPTMLTHREVLAAARASAAAARIANDDQVLAPRTVASLPELAVGLIGPLLAGARVMTMPVFNVPRVVEMVLSGDVTRVVADAGMHRELVAELERRGAPDPAAVIIKAF